MYIAICDNENPKMFAFFIFGPNLIFSSKTNTSTVNVMAKAHISYLKSYPVRLLRRQWIIYTENKKKLGATLQ